MTHPENKYPIPNDPTISTVNEVIGVGTEHLTDLGEVPLSAMLPEMMVDPNAAEAINNHGYVEMADGMQLARSRLLTGSINSLSGRKDSVGVYQPTDKDTITETSESEAVDQTLEFLENYKSVVASSPKPSENASSLAEYAADMADNTVYLSEMDVDKAAKGLASYWEAYLNESPSHNIIAVSRESKSSGYLADKILKALPEQLQKRIHSLDTLYDPDSAARHTDALQYIENTKVVLVDDWMISGRQMQTVALQEVFAALSGYADQSASPQDQTAARDGFEKKVEINLAIDSPNRIANGLRLNDGVVDMQVPVKAYWASPATKTLMSYEYGQPLELLVTGAHSSTDDGFENPCAAMTKVLREEFGIDMPMPPLTNIVRTYRGKPVS